MALQFLNNAIGTSATFTGVFTITDRLVLSDSLNNSFIGEDAGVNNTTGIYNVSLGYKSLYSNTVGNRNLGLGTQSLYYNTEGDGNVALGISSLQDNTTGDYNIALGYQSLLQNTTGGYNVALGAQSLRSNTGSFNIALGISALYNNTTANSNIALGHSSLTDNTTGLQNVALGFMALGHNTTGGYNIGFGTNAGKYALDGATSNTTGEESIFIGRNTRANANGEINQIVIGGAAIGKGSNTVTLGNDNIATTYLKGDVNITGTITGVGGEFLPLAGGTLTGGLSINQTTADFIDLTRDLTTDQTWRQAISGAGSFSLYDVTRGADVLILDTSGNATFAGTLQVDGSNLGIGGAPANASYGSVGTKLDLKGGADSIILLRGAAGGSGAGAYAASEYGLYAYNGEFLLTRTNQNGWWASPDFKLSGGNATFAGDVTLSSGSLNVIGENSVNTVGRFESGSGSTTSYLQLLPNGATDTNSGYIGYDTSNLLKFYTQNTLALTLDATQNATFAGNITAGDTDDGTALFLKRAGGANVMAINTNANGSWTMFDYAAGAYTSGITQKSGNVGIGTTSPRAVGSGYKGVEVSSPSSGSSLWLSGFSDTAKGYLSMDTGGLNLTAISNHSLTFGTNNVQRMRINSQGQTWLGGSFTGADIANGNGTYLNSLNAGGFSVLHRNAADAYIHFNTYYNSSNVYEAKYNATAFRVDALGNDTGLSFHKAPSVAAGATQTFSHVMAIGYGANNNVGIGTTSPGAKLTIGDPGGATTRAFQIEGNTSTAGINATIGVFSDATYIGTNYYYSGGQVKPVSTHGQTAIVQQTSATPLSNSISFNVSDHTDANSAPDTRMLIRSDGNVGIGSTDPQGQLSLDSQIANSGTPLTYSTVQQNVLNGYYTTGESPNRYMRYFDIACVGDGDGTNGGGNIRFLTNPIANDTAVERMRIDSSGNVGIGNTSPSSFNSLGGKQVVIGDGAQTNSLTLYSGSSNYGHIAFADSNASASSAQYAGLIQYYHGNDSMRFYTAASTKMTILTGGNVGIGTTSPDSLLHIYNPSANWDEEAVITLGTDIEGTNQAQLRYYRGLTDTTTESFQLSVKGTTALTALNNGNVGIGTTSPSVKLHVKETSAVNTAIFENSGTISYTAIKVAEAINNKAALSFAVGDALASTDIFGEVSGIVNNNGGALSGSLIFKTNSGDNVQERMRITSGGVVGIGDLNPTLASRLVVAAPSGSSNVCDIRTGTTANTNVGAIVFRNSASAYCGQITVNGATAVTNYVSASDYRLKEDLQDFAGLDMVSKIPVYDYKWKSAESRTYGVMAHELQEVLPQAVVGEKDAEEMQGVDYSKIVPLLIKSIQELTAKVERLEANK